MQREELCGLMLQLLLLLSAVLPVHNVQLDDKAGNGPSSPCTLSARSRDLHTCLQAIRKRAEDPSLFWFGSGYGDQCPPEDRLLADCYNPVDHDSGRGSGSVALRALSLHELDPDTLDRYLDVTWTTRPGSYTGCGNRFRYNQSREVTLDPLSMTVMSPYELRAQPRMQWPAENGSLYSLLFYDVGYFRVKTLHLNVPGNDLSEGETILEYEGPLNPTRNNNPYVFLLFRQSGPITLTDRWRRIVSRRDWEAELPDFMKAHSLKGPVALNWVLVYGDAYAAEVARTRGYMNTCARFVAKAFEREEIEFMPNQTYSSHALKLLNVYINVTFEATPVAVNSCCSLYNYPARTFSVNPLGQAMVLPAHTRSDTQVYVTLHMATAFPETQRDFKNKTLTLLMADPDVPLQAFGNPRLPFLHWSVVNIRGGDVASGHVVQGYMGPAPPDPKPHRYYFMLFLQSKDLDPARMDYSAVNCSWAFRGRCRFDVTAMVRENQLQLIGVTWMVARHDEFVRDLYVQAGMNPSCAACRGVPGYGDPCPPPTSPVSSSASAAKASSPRSWSGMMVALLCCVVVLPW